MFMDRRELKNALALYKIRNMETRLNKIILFGIPLFLFAVDLMGVWTKVFTPHDQITHFSLNTYSQNTLIFTLVFLLALALDYKRFNESHEVLPQTNNSRFLAYGLYSYSLLIKLLALALVLYLGQYGIISLISNFSGNVHFAYNFNLTFVLWGFIVNLIYGSLLISLILLIGVLDRKWNILFRITFTLFIFLLFFNNGFLLKPFMKVVSFWTKEPSLIVFTIKSVVLLVILSGLSWIINSKTIYFKSYNSRLSKKITAIAFAIVLIIAIPMILLTSFSSESGYIEVTATSENFDYHSSNKYISLPLDTSHLKEGDSIEIITNCNFEENMMSIMPFMADEYAEDVSFYGIDGKVDGLMLSYALPHNYHNLIDLVPYTNPKVTATLKGTKLYLNYDYDKNQKLIYLSPYGLMGQFEAFKDKNYFKNFMGTQGGAGNGYIYILTENGIDISEPIYSN